MVSQTRLEAGQQPLEQAGPAKKINPARLHLGCLSVSLLAWCCPLPQANADSIIAWGNPANGRTNVPPAATNITAVAGGGGFTLALRDDAVPIAWGSNSSGETNVPATVTGAVKIAAGTSHSLALRNDGAVIGWGNSTYNKTIAPAAATNVAFIVAGANHSAVLRYDGTVFVWGWDPYKITAVPASAVNVVRLAGNAADHLVALKRDGTVVAWGAYVNSQTNVPSTATNIVGVAAGSTFSLALRANGTVFGWGANPNGQLNVPAAATNIVAIAAAGSHGVALRNDGKVIAWGGNSLGQTNVPATVQNATAVSAGSTHSIAQIGDGTPRFVDSLGALTAYRGQEFTLNALAVGQAPLSYRWFLDGEEIPGATSPTFTITNVQTTAAGVYSVEVSNALGSITGTVANVTTEQAPARPSFLEHPQSQTVFAGTNVTFGVSVTGNPEPRLQWQRNNTNILGATNVSFSIFNVLTNDAASFRVIATNSLGAATSQVAVLTVNMPPWPVFTSWPSNTAVSLGNRVTLSASASGSGTITYQWQRNGETLAGVVGPSVTFSSFTDQDSGVYSIVASNEFGSTSTPAFQVVAVPVAVWGSGVVTNLPITLSNAVAIAAGLQHALALKADGGVAAWGNGDVVAWQGSTWVTNRYGFASVPHDITNAVAIAAGPYHNVVLKSDGTVTAWGYNLYGQTNVPASATNVVAIAAGATHNLALRGDGTVLAWGTNSAGQLTIPTTATGVVAVACGDSHSLALRSDGSVITWGNAASGLGTIPISATNIVSISARNAYSVALRADGRLIRWGNYPAMTPSGYPFVGDTDFAAIAAGQSHLLTFNKNYGVVSFSAVGIFTSSPHLIPPAWFKNPLALAAGNEFSMGLQPATALPRLQTAGRTTYLGNNAVFSGLTAGQRVGIYQWKFNNAPISGATGPHFAIPQTGHSNAGDYSVTITDSLSTVTSASTRLSVIVPPAPVITQQPVSQIVGAGSNAVFTVGTATGIPAAFQWQFEQADIAGATVSSLVVSNAQVSSAGDYRVIVSNAGGSVTSALANLTITSAPPRFIVQPQDRIVMVQASTTLNSLVSGSEPLSYQWQHNGIDIANGTNATFAILNAAEALAGAYQLIASNALGAATSSVAIVTIVPVVGWGGNNAGQLNLPLPATNLLLMAIGGDHVLGLQRDGTVTGWGSNACGQVSAPAAASNVVAIAAGHAHSLALQENGNVLAWGNNNQSQSTVPADVAPAVAIAGGMMHSIALRADGSLRAWGGNFRGEGLVPDGLSNVTAVAAGAFHNIALHADGKPVVWGAMNYTPAAATNVIAVTAGFAYCAALRTDGTVIAWGELQPPTGLAASATCGGYTVSGNISRPTNHIDIPISATNIIAITGGRHHIVALRADGEVIVWGDNSASQLDVAFSTQNIRGLFAGGNQTFVLVGSRAPEVVVFEPTRNAGEGGRVFFRPASGGLPALAYQWSRDDVILAGKTNPWFFLDDPRVEDSGVYTIAITNFAGAITGQVSLVVTASAPAITTQPIGQVIGGGTTATLSVAAIGSSPLSYQWFQNGTALTDGTAVAGTQMPTLTLENTTAASSGNYSVLVSNAVGTVVSSNAQLIVLDHPPISEALDATSLPWSTGGTSPWFWQTNTTKDLIDAAQTGPHTEPQTNWIETTVSGPVTISFWWKCTGWLTDRLSLSINDVEALSITDDVNWQQRSYHLPDGEHLVRWTYTCQPFAGTSTAWLDQVTITAPTPPTIAIQPASRSTAQGFSTSFNVTADGTAPLTYQWLFNSVAIVGATNNPLSISAVRSENAGSYQAIISNAAGSITSQVATLTITNSAPVLETLPVATTAAPGMPAIFTTKVGGTEPIAVQWHFNGSGIAGASSNDLVIPNVQPSNAGKYRIVLNNPYGTVIGNEVPLDIVPIAAWGAKVYNQVRVPATVGDVVQISAGHGSGMALRRDGSVATWGLTYGTATPPANDFIQVAAGYYHFAGLRANGTVAIWGNFDSRLGMIPGEVSDVVTIDADRHNVVVKSDGSVLSWPPSPASEVPESATNVVAATAGIGFTIALRDNGAVFGWGTNALGQLNIPHGVTNAVAISSGANHSLALRDDGTVVAWGDNTFGQTNVPSNLTNVVAIAAGSYHNLALRSDGTVAAWGNPSEGATIVSPTLENVIGIAGGGSHSLALVGDGSPVITIHPRWLRNGNKPLRVFAAGAGSLEYQWQINGIDIAGATNSWFSPHQSGTYTVVIRNSFGSITSVGSEVIIGAPRFTNSGLATSEEGLLFRATVDGLTGTGPVILYGSTNLVNWTPLATNGPVSGALVIEQLLSVESPVQFLQVLEQR